MASQSRTRKQASFTKKDLCLDWTPEEQATLESGLQKYASDPLFLRYLKISNEMPNKTTRDVASRARWMFDKLKSKEKKPAHTTSKIKTQKGIHSPEEGQSDYEEIQSKVRGGYYGELLQQVANILNVIRTGLTNLMVEGICALFRLIQDNIMKLHIHHDTNLGSSLGNVQPKHEFSSVVPSPRRSDYSMKIHHDSHSGRSLVNVQQQAVPLEANEYELNSVVSSTDNIMEMHNDTDLSDPSVLNKVHQPLPVLSKHEPNSIVLRRDDDVVKTYNDTNSSPSLLNTQQPLPVIPDEHELNSIVPWQQMDLIEEVSHSGIRITE